MRVEYDPRSLDYLAEMAKEGRLEVSDPGHSNHIFVRLALLKFPIPAIYIDSSEEPWRIVWGDHVSHLVRFVLGSKSSCANQLLYACGDSIPSLFGELILPYQRRLRETEIKIYRLYPPEFSENKDDLQMQFRAMVSALHPR